MYPVDTTPYDTFVPPPGAITLITTLIIIALVLWAKRRDERYATQALQDNEEPRPPE